MTLLEIKDLEVSFSSSSRLLGVVNRIDLSMDEGENLIVVGETGCGKSVLAMSVLGLLPVNAKVRGAIMYKGEDLLKMDSAGMEAVRGREIGLVPQSTSTSLNPILKIETQLAEGLRQAPDGKWSKETIKRILMDTGLDPTVAGMYPNQLSEGMKKRVLVGLGNCLSPVLLIADEPTCGLDIRAKMEVMNVLKNIVEQKNGSLFMITHDLDAASTMTGKLMVMYAGEIVEMTSTTDILKQEQLSGHPYTRALLRSMPQRGFYPLPGKCISPDERQQGCRFVNRCDAARPICHKEHPELRPLSEGHMVRCFYA